MRTCQVKSFPLSLTRSHESKFSGFDHANNRSQTAKLDVVVFRCTTSRGSLKPLQGHRAKSLFRNILHITPWGSRFYPEQGILNPCNPKKTNILRGWGMKKNTNIHQSLHQSLLRFLAIAVAIILSTPVSAEILKITVND